jgi:guanine deaminase
VHGRDLLGPARESLLCEHARIGFDDSFIYDQLMLPPDARAIPMLPLMRDEAQVAFREWERSETKIRY